MKNWCKITKNIESLMVLLIDKTILWTDKIIILKKEPLHLEISPLPIVY